MKVRDIMTSDPVWLASDASPDEALAIMDREHIRHLPLLADGKLVGILSDRDLLAATGWLPASVHACRGPHGDEKVPARLSDIMHERVATVEPDDELVQICVEFLASRIGCLPVVSDGRLLGIVTELDMLEAYVELCRRDDDAPWARIEVRDRMSPSPTTVAWYASLDEASKLCRTNGIHHLPVMESGRLVAILSDRDLRRALGSGWGGDTPIEEFLSRQLVTARPGDPLPDAAELMVEHKIGALPIVDQDELVGILSLTDVLDQCLESPLTDTGA